MKKHKEHQSGRSMVEMLTVLAISGVLTITGITAYNYAMTKHQANELVHKANLAYINVLTHDSLDSWTELKITSIDGTPTQGVIYKDAGFVLIDNVDKDICNTILKDKTNFSLMQTTNISFTTCKATNSMVFDFANAGDFGAKCIAGKCPLESKGQYCSTNTNTCIMKTACPDGEWNFDTDTCGSCESVNGNSAPVFAENICISCAESTNDSKPFWDTKNKICVNCLTNLDCESDSYCSNNTCTICPANSDTTAINNEQIPNTDCYCNDNYVLDKKNTSCIYFPKFCIYNMPETLPNKKITLTEKIGCPTGYYCYINWINTSCDSILKTSTGDLYGRCVTLNTKENITCPK